MKLYCNSLGLILFAFTNFTSAQDIIIPLNVTDNNHSITIWFGFDPLGSDGTDIGLDSLAPPPPPGGIDARFSIWGIEYLTDIRDKLSTEKQFHLSYVADIVDLPIVLHWDSSYLDSIGTFFIIDDILGTLFGPVDMNTVDSLVVTDPLILDGLRILVTGYKWVSAPSNLTAELLQLPWRIVLNWVDNSDNELGFVILRDDTNSTSFVNIDTVSANITTYTDTDVDPVFKYNYKIYAFSENGISEFSNIAQVLVPVELTSFSVSVFDNNVKLLWTTATEKNNLGFEIERMIDYVWEKIAFIEGNGTTSNESNYQFVDDFKYFSVKGIVKYRLKQIDFNGNYTYSDVVEVNADFTPQEYVLYQNYPNPFNPGTQIKFALPNDSQVNLTIYNSIGEVIMILVDEMREKGYHEINFNASDFSSGMYLYKLVANENIMVKKMIVLK